MYQCFQQIPSNQTLINQTLDSLIGLFQIYAFRTEGNYTNDFNITPIDIINELNQTYQKQFSSDWEFHNYINNLTKQFYDAHTKYRLPLGYGSFHAFLGYIPVYDKQQQSYVLYEKPQDDTTNFTTQYKNKYSIGENVEQPISSINGQIPTDFFQQKANEYSFYEKHEQGRYNELLQGLLSDRSLRTFGDIGMNDSMDITINGQNYTLKYLVYTTQNIESQDQLQQLNSRASQQVQKVIEQEVQQLKQRLFIETEHRNVKKSAAEPEPSQDFQLLYPGSQGGINLYLKQYNGDSQENYFLLTIQSFSPDDVQQWVWDFQNCTDIMDQYSSGHLIVMTAQNGGGYITLGFRSLAVLCPYLQPRYGLYDIVQQPLNEFFVTSTDSANTFSTQERYDPQTKEIFQHNEWYLNESQTVNNTVFSGYYSFDLAYDETPADVYESLLKTKTPNWLNTASNNLIAFVSDGTCGSTCFCFMGRGRIGNAGLFLGLAGNTNSSEQIPVASYAGGSVMSTDYTDQFDLSQYNVKPFDTSAQLSFAHEQIFDWNQTNRTLEYEKVESHDKIDVYWNIYGWYGQAKLEEIIDETKNKFDSKECYDFMKIQSDCTPDMTIKHGIYGHKCGADGKYNYDVCTVIACDIQYELVNDNECQVMKQPHNVTVSNSDNTATTIALSVVAGVVALAGLIALIFYMANIKKMNKHMIPLEEKPTEEEKLLDNQEKQNDQENQENQDKQ